MKPWMIGCLMAGLTMGCGSDVTETRPTDDRIFFFSTLSVTLMPDALRGCTSQFSADQDGDPFGKPAALVELTIDPGPAEATVFAYYTEDPPMNCPPTAAPFWTGPPGTEVDLSSEPIELAPGSSFTLQVDCEACVGEVSVKGTLKLEELAEP